jgi:hypothetical protein
MDYLRCHKYSIVIDYSDESNEELIHMGDFSNFIVGHPRNKFLKIHTYLIFKLNYYIPFLIIFFLATSLLNNYLLS